MKEKIQLLAKITFIGAIVLGALGLTGFGAESITDLTGIEKDVVRGNELGLVPLLTVISGGAFIASNFAPSRKSAA